jgi:hypothetical protein
MNANHADVDAVTPEAAAGAAGVVADAVTESPALETSPTAEPAHSEAPDTATPETATSETSVPEPRPAPEVEGETERGKAKKPRRAVRAKSTGGTKALVVWREGRLHYADENVLVIDLDEAASPDVDVHDVVDRLAELRDAADSTGRAETVAALGEIIQEKALS